MIWIIMILLLLIPIWIPVTAICYLDKRNKKEIKMAKEEEAKANNEEIAPYSYKKLDSVGIKREYYRVLFNEFVFSKFKGVSWWECPGEDVAIHFEGLHMTRLHFFDGTTNLIPVYVMKEEKKANSGGEKWNIFISEKGNEKKTNEEICDEWLQQKKDVLDNAFEAKTLLSFTLGELPEDKDIIDMILDKLSLRGMFNSSFNETGVELAPVMD